MCCLFGMLDYGGMLTGRQRARALSILAAECECRGIDAAGVAYNSNGGLHIYKRPGPAHKLRLRIPNDAQVIMGHTRMTTQGSERKNYNNHPFPGQAGGVRFALAHNGVLHNDQILRRSLPPTKIETDSYVAVQLIERQKILDLISLKCVAEQVKGSFVFTLLDERNNWYLVKEDNPMCLCHFPESKLYLYASTEEILGRALRKMRLGMEKPQKIETKCGDLLKINRNGVILRNAFAPDDFYYPFFLRAAHPKPNLSASKSTSEAEYLAQLKAVASCLGYSPDCVEEALRRGYTTEDIEEWLYCGQL